MNVDKLYGQNMNINSEFEKGSAKGIAASSSDLKSQALGYSLDITGSSVQNASYGKKDLKSLEEFTEGAAMQDVTMNRNYMAVMSVSMSDEDFAQMTKDGANPLKTEVSESVTNLDKIKIKMAESGNIIAGYNDDLSEQELTNALGDNFGAACVIRKSLNNADLPDTPENIEQVKEMFSVAGKLKPLTDESIVYMLEEGLAINAENLYKAEYSAAVQTNGSHGVRFDGAATLAANTLSDKEWENIKPRALEIVKSAGCPDEEAGLDDAKWLITHEIPLTKENIEAFEDIKDVILPMENKEILNVAISAIEEGISPVEAQLTESENLYTKAVRIRDSFMNLSDGGDISKRRLLEEVRLHMSCEANLTLLRKGISIETEDLGKLVEELKEAERDFYRPLLADRSDAAAYNNAQDDSLNGSSHEASDAVPVALDEELDRRIDLYKRTQKVLRDIPTVPLRTIADTAVSDDFSLGNIEKSAEELKNAYNKAGESYEALMTRPRADMGDSIRKAFRNVDDILTDLDFELNDTNRKAVRCLGYAGMMINKESVENIRQAAGSVERVIQLMTPAKTLSMIREGHNPLSENIYELEEELSSENFEETEEKYSEFLWKLEKSGNITENEKSAFIGMYRLFDKIEKMDGKVIGNVLSNGQELTLSNMLSAVRSNKHMNKDVIVDDDFGMLESISRKSDSISQQIEKGFMQVMSQPVAKDYAAQKMKTVRAAGRDNADAQELLALINEPVTIENIAAINDMSSGMGKSFKRLFGNNSSESKEDRLTDEDAEEILDSFSDGDETESAYEKFMLKAQSICADRVLKSDTYSDVQNYAMSYKQIGFAKSLSRGRDYEVPIHTQEGWTSAHVSFKAANGKTPNVTVSFEAAEYGRVKGTFTVKDDGVDGIVVSDSRDGTENIKSRDEAVRNELTKENFSISNLCYVYSRGINADKYYEGLESENASGDNNMLYKIAKAFIKAVNDTGGDVT